MPVAMYMAEGRLLAKCDGVDGQAWDGSQLVPMPSKAYFCPLCGEVWARVIITVPGTYHEVKTRFCRNHARKGTEDGTFGEHQTFRYRYGSVPREVLLWDFLQLCENHGVEGGD